MTKTTTCQVRMARASDSDIKRSWDVYRAATALQRGYWCIDDIDWDSDRLSDIPREWRLFFGRCVQFCIDTGAYGRIQGGFLALQQVTDPDLDHLELHPALKEAQELAPLVSVYESALQEANAKIAQLYSIIFDEIPGISPHLKDSLESSDEAEYESELRAEIRKLIDDHRSMAYAFEETAGESDLPVSSWLQPEQTVWPAEVKTLFANVTGAEALPEHHQQRLYSHLNRMLLERLSTAEIIKSANTLVQGME